MWVSEHFDLWNICIMSIVLAKRHQLPTSLSQHHHLTPYDLPSDRSSEWEQRWKWNRRKKPKTRNGKKNFFHYSQFAVFVSSDNCFMCALSACGKLRFRNQPKKAHWMQTQIWRIIVAIWLVLLCVFMVRVVLLTATRSQSHSIVRLILLGVFPTIPFASTAATPLRVLSFSSVQIFGRILTAPRSVPKLNWMIFVLRADDNNNLCGVVCHCLMHTNRKEWGCHWNVSIYAETRCHRIRSVNDTNQRMMWLMKWIFRPIIGCCAPGPRIISYNSISDNFVCT